MKLSALIFALALGLATPGFAAEHGHDRGVGIGGHIDHRGVGVGAHIGGAHVGVRVGGEHRYRRGYHGGFIGGPYGGPYYGDPCWNWVPIFGWVYACD